MLSKLEFARLYKCGNVIHLQNLQRADGTRSATCARALDNPGMTSTSASSRNAGHPSDHIAPSGVHYKIGQIQSASKQSKWRTLRLGKEDLNSRFELLVLPHLDSAYNLPRCLLPESEAGR